MSEAPTSVRIDKWLWAARFFKTRALASDACELGRIEANAMRAKASRIIHAGDKLRIKNEAGEFLIDILALSDTRGPAAVAQTLYRETDESRELRRQATEERKTLMDNGMITERRPSKQDRRKIASLRGRIHRF